MLAYKRQKQTLQADFFFQFFSELSLNVLLQYSWGDAAVVFLCRLRSSPCVRYGGEQPQRRRWRKTLGCHRDADVSAPSVKGKTDCGGLSNIVSAAKKKKKGEEVKSAPWETQTSSVRDSAGSCWMRMRAEADGALKSELRAKIFSEYEGVIGRRWRGVGPTCTSDPTSVFFHAGKKCD